MKAEHEALITNAPQPALSRGEYAVCALGRPSLEPKTAGLHDQAEARRRGRRRQASFGEIGGLLPPALICSQGGRKVQRPPLGEGRATAR
jgi:hypothetical protein